MCKWWTHKIKNDNISKSIVYFQKKTHNSNSILIQNSSKDIHFSQRLLHSQEFSETNCRLLLSSFFRDITNVPSLSNKEQVTCARNTSEPESPRRSPKWGSHISAGYVCRPNVRVLWESHWNMKQTIYLSLINKQCWQAGTDCVQTCSKTTLLKTTSHTLTSTYVRKVLGPILGLLELTLLA